MSLIRTIQDAIVAHLQGLTDFAGVSIVGRVAGDVSSEVEAAIARTGLAVYVFPPQPVQTSPERKGLFFEVMEIRCQVLENPTAKPPDTDLDAYQLAELVLYHLHLWDPSVTGCNVFTASPRCLEFVPDQVLVAFNCLFSTSGGYEVRT